MVWRHIYNVIDVFNLSKIIIYVIIIINWNDFILIYCIRVEKTLTLFLILMYNILYLIVTSINRTIIRMYKYIV